MKMLNLDDIALDSERTVKYRGIEYPVRDFDVSEFIKFQKHFALFQKAYNSTDPDAIAAVVEEAVALTKIGVPTMDADLVRTLNPLQMLALVSMIANLLPEPDEETTTAAESLAPKTEAVMPAE